MFCRTRCDDSDLSSLVPKPLESRVLTNWRFWVFEKTPILFDFLSNSHDLLIFWKRSLGDMFHGVDAKLSSKFHRIWTSFTQDLTFGALLAGYLGATGLTGLSNRSDRSGIWIPSPTGLTGLCNLSERSLQASSVFRLVLLPRCDLGLLLRDSLFIAILADLSLRACGDFGT